MECISQKDIDETIEILKTNKHNKLAKKLKEADIIPKLYVEAYIESLRNNLKDIKDPDELGMLSENVPKLQLYQIEYSTNKLEAVKSILYNALERKGKFCDFNDSKFHDTVKRGVCQCEDHDSNLGWAEEDKPNKDLELKPVYYADEDTMKFNDDPEWWCKECRDSQDDACDVEVSCDMETD